VSRNVFLSLFFQDWASTEKEFGGEPEKAADRREKEEDKTPSVGADPNTTVTLPVIDQVIFFCRSMSRQLARHRCFYYFNFNFISVHQDYTQATYVLLAEYDENGVLVIPDQVHATGITFLFLSPPPPSFTSL
jgi:hypothetical protein